LIVGICDSFSFKELFEKGKVSTIQHYITIVKLAVFLSCYWAEKTIIGCAVGYNSGQSPIHCVIVHRQYRKEE
jgi:hypothetical protein